MCESGLTDSCTVPMSPDHQQDWPTVVRLPRNTRGRDIAVGDIHGHFTRVERELERVGFEPARDRLVCVGDLVDRGPESADVARWLREPWFYSVLGNHDISLLASRQIRFGQTFSEYRYFVCDSHSWMSALPEMEQQAVADALARLPIAIELETAEGLVGIVHAEVSQHSWAAFTEALLDPAERIASTWSATWQRRLARSARAVKEARVHQDVYQLDGVRHVIHGHSVLEDLEIKRLGNRYFIETAGWLDGGEAVEGTLQPRFTLVDVRWPWQPL